MKTMTKRIFLTGSRGSGKTSVGKELAKRLGWQFVDTDELLCKMQGRAVAEIVETEGWDAFRNYESEALEEAAKLEPCVIATGGGMVLREKNRIHMRSNGVVVFLDVPVAELARRLGNDPLESQRPSLTGKSLADEIQEVLDARISLYEGTAHVQVDGAQPVNKIIDNILELLDTNFVS